MKENLLDNNDENKELLELDDNKDNSEGLKQIKTISSESNKINNINSRANSRAQSNLNKKFSLKRDNSIFSEFRDLDSRNSSIASSFSKERANTLLSRDCVLGGDSASVELKNEMMSLNPDTILPPLLFKRTKMFKEMSYVDILKLEKSEISKPLLNMNNVNDIETAKQMFRNLLSYMKIRKSSKEPILHAKKILLLVRQANPIIKDEAYLQVYKQLHDNHEYDSYMAAFKMLAILSSCFVPDNKDIYMFILKYLYEEMKDNKNNLVLNHIKYIFQRMLKTKEHERKNVPCKEELEFIEFLRPIPIVVHLFDGNKISVNVESYTSIKEVKEKVINNLFLDDQNSEIKSKETVYIFFTVFIHFTFPY